MNSPYLDHLAIGVRSLADAYSRYVSELGGVWSHGGDAGDFDTFQLIYEGGMRMEFLSPSQREGGFLQRFIDRSGPGPHHITFKVPSLFEAVAEVERLGIEPLAGQRNLPAWKEAFLHPKHAAMGTLIQLAEAAMPSFTTPPPEDLPVGGAQSRVSWVGLTTQDLTIARRLFLGLLDGEVCDDGAGWFLTAWGPGRRLLIRTVDSFPGHRRLWSSTSAGVDHVLMGPESVLPSSLTARADGLVALPSDARTGQRVWIAGL